MAKITAYYDNLLQDLAIRNPTKYPAKLLFENFNFYNKFYKLKFSNNHTLQNGGSKYKDYNYKDCVIRVYKRSEDDKYVYAIHNNNDDENTQECVLIFIPKNEDVPFAYIENISAYDNCFRCSSMKTKTGTILLNFLIIYIKTKLVHHNLKYIQLRDNSLYFCKTTSKNIKFSAFYMLTRGDTWYGRSKFIPFDEVSGKVHKQNMHLYSTNNHIVTETKLHQINMFKLLYRASVKLKMTDTYSKQYILDLLDTHKTNSIKDFLYYFTKNLDQSCAIFGEIYGDLMSILKMTDMYGWIYYMPL
jgi:hypothetical protein